MRYHGAFIKNTSLMKLHNYCMKLKGKYKPILHGAKSKWSLSKFISIEIKIEIGFILATQTDFLNS